MNVSLRVIQNFLNYVFQAQVTNREARQLVAKKSSLFVVLSFSPQMALARAHTDADTESCPSMPQEF